jgi:hypothetical protein
MVTVATEHLSPATAVNRDGIAPNEFCRSAKDFRDTSVERLQEKNGDFIDFR